MSGPRLGGWEAIDDAVDALRAGKLVAIPTETVYGLGADASNPAAVAKIFAAKGRPTGHPLIVHLADPVQLQHWAATITPAAHALATTFWPGPLTLIVHRADHVLDAVTGGRTTVGLRVPSHPLTHELLTRFGGGVAAPSANRFGRLSPTTAEAVIEDLGEAVAIVLDGGPCSVGIESTIVDTTTDPPQVLRAGGITRAQIEEILGAPTESASGPSRAPGMLASHYAPRARVDLVESRVAGLAEVARLHTEGRRAELLDGGSDLVAAARGLYAAMRAADHRGADVIIAVLPPPGGLGDAIRDRLKKAAAPRRTAG